MLPPLLFLVLLLGFFNYLISLLSIRFSSKTTPVSLKLSLSTLASDSIHFVHSCSPATFEESHNVLVAPFCSLRFNHQSLQELNTFRVLRFEFYLLHHAHAV